MKQEKRVLPLTPAQLAIALSGDLRRVVGDVERLCADPRIRALVGGDVRRATMQLAAVDDTAETSAP